MDTQWRSMYHRCLFRYNRRSGRHYLAGKRYDLSEETEEGDGGDEGDLSGRQGLGDERAVVPDVDEDEHEDGVSRGDAELVQRVEEVRLVLSEDELEVDAVALVDVDVDAPEPQLEAVEHLQAEEAPERLHLDACEGDGELESEDRRRRRVECS